YTERARFNQILEVPAPTSDRNGTEVRVTDLEPATSYVYRVIVQSGSETYTSPIGRFRTQPTAGDPVRFAVLADTQQQWEGENRLAAVGDAIATDSDAAPFDFVLHAGDLVESPAGTYWDYWFDSFDAMLLAAPFLPVLGNHEKNSRSYYDAFPHPPGAGQNDERWWALHWGDVAVVGLDTSATRADRIIEQQAYAEKELSGPERHKFVIFHHPVFSSDAYHGSGYGYEKIYHPIFVRTGVDVVLNGHAHNYERIARDGITYLVLGGGGAVPRELATERVDGSIVAVEGRNFYARIATTRKGIAVDIVAVARADETSFTLTPGELLDSFVLPCASDESRTPWAALVVVAALVGILLWILLRGDP
ncbi:MAG: metallophosphoesterase, partial [Candidatus Bipolaricaulis sp.]|nr:metallophosphoesterase [Candidatus Bipolaricaulis sp.]